MGGRKVIKLVIYPEAKEALDRCAEQFDMKQQGVSSRIIEWFGSQPEDIKRVILGHYSPFTDNVIEMILQGLKSKDPPNKDTSSKTPSQTGSETEEKLRA